MTTSKARHLVAIFVPITLIAMSALVVWRFPAQDVARTVVFALLMLAVLATNLVPGTRRTLTMAGLATCALLVPEIVAMTVPRSDDLLWVACLWIVTVLLLWEQKPNAIDVDELQNALNQGPTGLIISDLNGVILSASEQIARVFRIDHASLVGRPLSEFLDASVWSFVTERSSDLLNGDAIDIEFEVSHDDGKRHVLVGHGKLARDRTGQPRYYVIQVADLSRERAAKRALQVASQQMHKLLRASSDLVMVTDHRWQVTFSNDPVEEFVGAPASDIVDQPVYDCVDIADRKRFMQALKAFTDNGLRESTIKALHLVAAPEQPTDVHIIRLSDSPNSPCALIFATAESQATAEAEREAQARFSQVFHVEETTSRLPALFHCAHVFIDGANDFLAFFQFGNGAFERFHAALRNKLETIAVKVA